MWVTSDPIRCSKLLPASPAHAHTECENGVSFQSLKCPRSHNLSSFVLRHHLSLDHAVFFLQWHKTSRIKHFEGRKQRLPHNNLIHLNKYERMSCGKTAHVTPACRHSNPNPNSENEKRIRQEEEKERRNIPQRCHGQKCNHTQTHTYYTRRRWVNIQRAKH